MKSLSLSLCIILFLLGASTLAAGADPDPTSPLFSLPSQKAQDFTLKDLSGKSVSLQSLRGKVVLLDFTTTWCPYCKKDIPNLKKLYESMKGKNFELIAIYINEDPKRVAAFASRYALPYPILLDTDASVARNYGIRGVPTKIVVKKDGSLACWQCFNPEDRISEALKEK